MGINFAFGWEIPFMAWLQTAGTDAVVKVCTLFSLFGESSLMIAMVGVFYWGINKEIGKKIAANFAASNLIAPFIKNIFIRRRPYMDHDAVKCLRPAVEGDIYDLNLQGYSCPSLHSANTGTVLATIAICLKKKLVTVISGVLIVGIGLSRIMLGVHYPTDVLLGWIIALIVVIIVPKIVEKAKNYLVVMFIYLAAGLPGWFFCTSDDFFVGYGAIIGIFLGFYVEEKYVHFENSDSVFEIILRTVCGVIVTLAVLEGLKIFFPASLSENAGFVSYLIRTFRYAAATFFGMGIYPMFFKRMSVVFKRRKQKETGDDSSK